jgi:YHS domain-containing protein
VRIKLFVVALVVLSLSVSNVFAKNVKVQQKNKEAVSKQVPAKAVLAINAGNKVCPVSGAAIADVALATHYEYKGKIYNLSSSDCIKTFKQDPKKYIDIVNKELNLNKLPKEKAQPIIKTQSTQPAKTK